MRCVSLCPSSTQIAEWEKTFSQKNPHDAPNKSSGVIQAYTHSHSGLIAQRRQRTLNAHWIFYQSMYIGKKKVKWFSLALKSMRTRLEYIDSSTERILIRSDCKKSSHVFNTCSPLDRIDRNLPQDHPNGSRLYCMNFDISRHRETKNTKVWPLCGFRFR